MRIEKIVLRKMKVGLKAPFETSFGVMTEKDFILAEVYTKDFVGNGDCSAFPFRFIK